MIDVEIKPLSLEEYLDIMNSSYVYAKRCCTTEGEGINCGSSAIVYKVYINGWISDDPFYICKKCRNDYLKFGQMTLLHHPLEVIRGKHVSIYPEIECVTIRPNTVDDRDRQIELTPKTLEIREIKGDLGND